MKTVITSVVWMEKWTLWAAPATGMTGVLTGNSGKLDGDKKPIMVPLTLRRTAGYEIHCGGKSYLLGTVDGTEVVACANAGSGIAVLTKDPVNQPKVAWVSYDTVNKQVGSPVLIDPLVEEVPDVNVKRYLSPGGVGYFIVGFNVD